jgi:hypothetical protein
MFDSMFDYYLDLFCSSESSAGSRIRCIEHHLNTLCTPVLAAFGLGASNTGVFDQAIHGRSALEYA